MEIFFLEHVITNIFSLKDVQSKLCVTYDSASGIKFSVHKPNGVDMHFTMFSDGLHYHETNQRPLALIQINKQTSEG